ncbi:MAG: RHS repeat-associated core domain-containing protein [Kiritimatiellae bacterium]|nr:RHS repeat-associated core domain-containing protein [Kiritimatiellia bacterium]
MKKQVLPFLPLIATIGGVVAALAAGNHPPAGAPDDIVVLGEVDLAERAEIWRNQYRRMTPGDGTFVQDVGAWPAAWEEFDSHWDAAPATRDLATWLVPVSVSQENGLSVIRDADGTVLWSGATDFAKDESATVTLVGDLVDEADWPLYEAAREEIDRRMEETFRPVFPGGTRGTNGAVTNGLRFTNVWWEADGNYRLDFAWETNGDVQVFCRPMHSESWVETVVWTNDENEVVTNDFTRWRQLDRFLGRPDAWELLGVVALTNGGGSFIDTTAVPDFDRVRFYAAAKLGDADGNGNAVQVAYLTNGVDQVASLWDGNGNETRWNYDEWGLTTNKVYADGSQEVYRYDLLGRLTNKLNPAGNATVFSYDANGNLASLQRGASAPFTFAYDALNRRTNMVDSVGATAWRYDAMGRLVGESGPFGTPEVQVAYDPNGRLTNVTWGAFSVDYAFDDLGRIVSVSAPEGAYAFTYLSNGIRRATVAYPNGVTEVRAHDELARCTSLAFLSGTNPLLSIAYAYDAGDRRTNEVWSTGRAMAYGYDDAHQLTSVAATRPSDAARYHYDAAGNPVDRAELGLDVTNSFNNLNQIVTGSWTGATLTVAGSVNYPAGSISVNGQPGTVYPDSSFDVAAVPAAPGTNTLTATYTGPAYTNAPMTATDTSTVVLGDTAFTHDANGNLTSDATFTYQYDLANQLTNVIRKADNTRVLSCRYDALGRRVEAIRSDGTVDRYVYFPGTFLVLAVLDGSNTPKEFYTRGPDLSGTLASAGGISGILACTYTNAPSAPLFHHADLMGNVIALTDTSTVLLSTICYTPFGQLLSSAGSFCPRHLFSSKEWDVDIHCLYHGYRHYNPSLAQWMEKDSISPETEAYRYCGGNSVASVDAWGLYQANVHFFATYQMAIAAGYKEQDALALAYYTEYPDEVDELDAIYQGWVGWPFWASDDETDWMTRTQMAFHQLNGQTVAYERTHVRCCLRKIFLESQETWEKGFALHALGDSYAHIVRTKHQVPVSRHKHYRHRTSRLSRRYGPHVRRTRTVYGVGQTMYSPGLGHFWHGTSPDIVSNRPNLAMSYLQDAYQLISNGDTVLVDNALLDKWTNPGKNAPSFRSMNPVGKPITQQQMIQWKEKLERCLAEQQ